MHQLEIDKVRHSPYLPKSFNSALLIDNVSKLMLKIMPENKNKLRFSCNKDIIDICQNVRFLKTCPRKIPGLFNHFMTEASII